MSHNKALNTILTRHQAQFSKNYKTLVGVLLALASGILFTTNNFLVALCHVSPCHLVLVRSLIQVLVFTSFCLYKKENLLPGPIRQKMFILLQGLAAGLMLCSSITSFTLMPVPDALCIIFACPMVTISLSALVLQDSRITLHKTLSGACLFLGVVFVCKPPFIFHEENVAEKYECYYLGVALATTACVAMGVMCVMVAKIKEISAPVLANWASIFGLIMGVIYWIIKDRDYTSLLQETPLNWAILVGQ